MRIILNIIEVFFPSRKFIPVLDDYYVVCCLMETTMAPIICSKPKGMNETIVKVL